MDIESLEADQLKILARKKEIILDLERSKKRRLAELKKLERIEIGILELQQELVPLENGFWEGRKVFDNG